MRERGQSIVELALLVPLVVALAIGLFEAGVVAYNYRATSQAVRAAGNTLAMGGSDSQVKEVLLTNARDMMFSMMMTYTIDTYSIFPAEGQRNEKGEVVGLKVTVKAGTYVPILGKATLSSVKFAEIRPLGRPYASSSSGTKGPIVPWAVQEQSFQMGTSYVVYGGATGGPGNWGQIGWAATPNEYRDQIANGLSAAYTSVGSIIPVQPGFTPQQTFEGIVNRFTAANFDTDGADVESWSWYSATSPRLILVPSVSDFPAGSANRRVLRMSRFFLDTVTAVEAGTGLRKPIDWSLFYDPSTGAPVSNPWTVLNANYTVNAANPIHVIAIYLEDGKREVEPI